jgi:hypothetical protein
MQTANPTLILAWSIVCLVLLVCGTSLFGVALFTRQLSSVDRATPISRVASSSGVSLRV